MLRPAIPSHQPTCWRLMPYGLPREPSFCVSWIPALAECGQLLFLRPTGDGMSAPATASSNLCNAALERREAGTSIGNRTTYQPASMGAISSHRLQPCLPAVSRHLARLAPTML